MAFEASFAAYKIILMQDIHRAEGEGDNQLSRGM